MREGEFVLCRVCGRRAKSCRCVLLVEVGWWCLAYAWSAYVGGQGPPSIAGIGGAAALPLAADACKHPQKQASPPHKRQGVRLAPHLPIPSSTTPRASASIHLCLHPPPNGGTALNLLPAPLPSESALVGF